MKKRFLYVVSGMILASPVLHAAEVSESNFKATQDRDARMEWWREARFGMFIHWGVYADLAGVYDGEEISGGGEWIMLMGKIPKAEYKKRAAEFNPTRYDPDAWVRLAKQAGMKYIVITAKHHDGFALFDSKVTDWDVVDSTLYGRDLLKPLAEACRAHGLKLGFYYSHAQDWYHPGGGAARGGHWDPAQEGDMDDYLREIAAPQVKELLTEYGDVAVLWWDFPHEMTRERTDILSPLTQLHPGIIMNDRLGNGSLSGFDTAEQRVPGTGYPYDWEACMTMNKTWGYKGYDDQWKSTGMLLEHLIDIASKGGNYLLNVGPTGAGLIPEESVVRLKEIGEWMGEYGEAVYGTTSSPFPIQEWGRCTKKALPNGDTRLYLHVFDGQENAKIHIPILNKVVRCRMMSEEEKALKASCGGDGITLHLQGDASNELISVIVLDIRGIPQVVVEPVVVDADNPFEIPMDIPMVLNGVGGNNEYKISGKKKTVKPEVKGSGNPGWKWYLEVEKAGEYDVELKVYFSTDDEEYRIMAGDEKIEILTGAYNQERLNLLAEKDRGGRKTVSVGLGSINFPKSGIYPFTFEVVKRGFQMPKGTSIKLTRSR